ncbi:MAG: class I SAM-dependent methyltransferase [Dehalococcoidales bacterium]|nr:class I SAM-dependent methyltransferase [Dehalococcoidales bacterium]
MWSSNKLDIGCGVAKKDGYVGMDKRPIAGVEIIHDLEVIPYPIDTGTFAIIRAHHVLEHIKPWLTVDVMDELWRIMAVGGDLQVDVPYGGTQSYRQDPTHCNEWIELTFEYFDVRKAMYQIYQPRPWNIVDGFPLRINGEFLRCALLKVEG